MADKLGRYGAVARINTIDGRHFTRFLTLFRAPDGMHEWLGPSADGLPLNPQLGIDPAIAVEHDDLIRGFFNRTLRDGAAHSSDAAVFLAWLSETQPGQEPISTFNGPEAADRQWWVGLKRRLNGNDRRFPESFVCPRPIAPPSVPVLREGTVQEAGFQTDAIDEIDAVLQEWAANSDQAFIACIARHGVIILHRAYGVRDGQPMTTETKSWMASLTKLLNGTLVMMAVDQGLIDLDAPINVYLPAFEGIQTETPATVRHLFTHTAGLWGHWGDERHDFEHLVAAYYPHLKIGRMLQYNGASLALGSKILEQVTGESLPQLYKNHLLDPLGCTNTEVSNSSYDARSTAIDMARIGQMILNRGAYGDKRFFRESTFEQMLPQRLTQLLGPETTAEWGIGTIWFNMFFPSDGLSLQTFTHGSASNSRLLIDPENDLIISMTRNRDGCNFDKYASIFNRIVMENLIAD